MKFELTLQQVLYLESDLTVALMNYDKSHLDALHKGAAVWQDYRLFEPDQ